MTNTRPILPSLRVLIYRYLAVLLGVILFTANSMADVVERSNPNNTYTASGSDVATVQTAANAAEGDVLTISGTATHNSNVAPFHSFTVQSANSSIQTINAGTAGFYTLSDASSNYNVTLSNLNYQGNSTAYTNDGGTFMKIEANTQLNLDNTTFSGFNLSGKHGGVLWVKQGELTINSTGTLSFANNQALGSDGRGGAIYAYTDASSGAVRNKVTINGDTIEFLNNSCTIGGGAVARAELTLTGSNITFKNNSAVNNDGGAFHGGLLSITGKDANSVTSFEGNTAVYIGGAVSATEVVLSTGSFSFDQNKGKTFNTNGRGGAVSTGTFTTDNVQTLSFTNNTSASKAGALYATGDISISAQNVTFENNKTTAGTSGNTAYGKGGGIFADGGNVTIDANTILFKGNSAKQYGAAIRVESNKNLSLTGSSITFDGNVISDNDGGAISGSNLTITGKDSNSVTTFKNNSSKYIGGAIGNSSATFSTGSFYFDNNKATTYHTNARGGAIHSGSVKFLNAENISFTNNVGTYLGGAISATSVEISAKNITFTGNKAYVSGQTNGQGGAIYCTGAVTFSGESATAVFSNNSASDARGNDLYLSGTGGLTFKDNGTYSFDGGIYINTTNHPDTVINEAQVKIAGRANDSTNNYQFYNVNISNGGKLTINWDNINSLTGTFNTGTADSAGTLEFNVGEGVSKELAFSDSLNVSGAGAVVKSGAGSLTLSGSNMYSCDTTVSGGTLLIDSSSFASPTVTVMSGGTLQLANNQSLNTQVVLDGGNLAIGDTTQFSEAAVNALSLDGGTISFDFFNTYNDGADLLNVSSASLNSGYIDLTFRSDSADVWWNYINDNYSDGFYIISGNIEDYEQFNSNNVKVSVNGTPSSDWTLAATANQLLLLAKSGPAPVSLYWDANSPDDRAAGSWPIDGTDKLGIVFTEGGQTAEYGNSVIMQADGTVEVSDGKNLTLSGVISGEGGLEKTGAGTLTLSGDNTYTKGANVNEGTLQLTGDAVKANSSIEIADDATLEYNVASGEKSLDFTTSNTTVSGNGNVTKTGAGKLKIKADGEQFSADKFAVSAGELDFKGQYNGDLNVQRGATLSPGNSVGDLTVYGNVIIDAGATGLFEFSAYNENQFDTLTIANADNSFSVDTNSIIKLYFEGNDADLWAAEGAEYKLVSDEGFVSATTDMSDLLGNFTNLFGLEGRTDGLYLVALNGPIPPEPGSGVPEPSTWALMALGVIVLFLRKRVRS